MEGKGSSQFIQKERVVRCAIIATRQWEECDGLGELGKGEGVWGFVRKWAGGRVRVTRWLYRSEVAR